MKKLPSVLETHRIGNRGEVFLEFIMSKHCLMNKIVGHRDVGVDYICEWLHGDAPTRILFGIQVKTTERDDIKLTSKGSNRRMNELTKYEINPSPFDIDPKTFEYWRGLNIPLYLFLVIKNQEDVFDCYYARLTPTLHKKGLDTSELINQIKKGDFYKANENSQFNAVVPKPTKDGGFIRDLLIDSVRCSYQNGSVACRDPGESGINWPKDTIYPDVLGEEDSDYVAKVKKGLLLLENNGLIKIAPDFESKIAGLKKKVNLHQG